MVVVVMFYQMPMLADVRWALAGNFPFPCLNAWLFFRCSSLSCCSLRGGLGGCYDVCVLLFIILLPPFKPLCQLWARGPAACRDGQRDRHMRTKSADGSLLFFWLPPPKLLWRRRHGLDRKRSLYMTTDQVEEERVSEK